MKNPGKGERGRPRMPPDQRRDKPLYVLLTKGEHQGLVEVAKRNARSLSEEVVRRLHATLQWPDWEDAIGLLASSSRIARRVLLEQGWKQWDDPRHGLMLLAPGSTAPANAPAVTDANVTQPQSKLSDELIRVLAEDPGAWEDPSVLSKLVVQEPGSAPPRWVDVAELRARRGKAEAAQPQPNRVDEQLIEHKVRDFAARVRQDIERTRAAGGEVSERDELVVRLIEQGWRAWDDPRVAPVLLLLDSPPEVPLEEALEAQGFHPRSDEEFEAYNRQYNAQVALQNRDSAVQARQNLEQRRAAGDEVPKQEELVVRLLELFNEGLQNSVRQNRAEDLFPQAKTRHEQDTGERRKRRAPSKRRRAAKSRGKAGGKVA
jgi:hypothetical protein